jgi:hypothetical protein
MGGSDRNTLLCYIDSFALRNCSCSNGEDVEMKGKLRCNWGPHVSHHDRPGARGLCFEWKTASRRHPHRFARLRVWPVGREAREALICQPSVYVPHDFIKILRGVGCLRHARRILARPATEGGDGRKARMDKGGRRISWPAATPQHGGQLGAYILRLKNFRPSQYAPPIRMSAGKPTPAIGPGAPTAPARAGSTKAAKPTEAKPAIRIRFMMFAPRLCPRQEY